MTFDELNLNKNLQKALNEMGIIHPTSIQSKSFSTIMSGKDVVGIAQTGTGKTLAFLLPVLRMWSFAKDRFPQVLIIVPTRELVIQIKEEMDKLNQFTNFVTVPAYGGANIKNQVAEIELGCDAVVSTPGRLLDLCLKGALKLKNIKRFIVDEVDEMLALGFLPQLKRVIEYLPEKRQNLLFSATMTTDVERIIEDFFNRPVRIEAAPMGTPLENINQSLYYVRNFHTKVNLLKYIIKDESLFSKVLIFTDTKKKADLLHEEILDIYEEDTGVIHSNKSQNYRFNSVKKFASGEYRLLIATDIVARGIDVSQVSHVINFDIPASAENYIHRIGRTGRADKKGNAISFAKDAEIDSLAAIEKLMKYNIPIQDFPEEVTISDVLIESEMPQYKMKNIEVRRRDAAPSSEGAFHEKKDKNKKVNQKVRYEEKMKLKYKKPKTRGAKKKNKKGKKIR
jgi:ATP-dependent RNA helicase RhlE